MSQKLFPKTGLLSIFIFLSLFFAPVKSHAWSLKTHLWIAQQVLNDVLDDGKVTILGRNYSVPPIVLNALRSNPGMFRSGNLGPDLYPDLVIGQVTTHPGIEGGWQTDQWLSHLLKGAKSPESVAMAYGFLSHASGDMFAHTYVNNYAGDIFNLLDKERDVELRHFVLEKYIESLTPAPLNLDNQVVDWTKDLRVAKRFLSEQLILNGDVNGQYLKSKTGLHLSAMYGVKQAVDFLHKETSQLIKTITAWAAKYFKEFNDLTIDLQTGKQFILMAEADLIVQRELLGVKETTYRLSLEALDKAREIVNKHPEIIAAQTSLLATQTRLAADALARSVQIAGEVNSAVSSLDNQVSSLQDELMGFTCRVIKKIPFVGKVFSSGCDKIRKLNSRINSLRRQIQGERLRANAAAQAAKEAANLAKETKNLVDKLESEYKEAVKGLANKTYETARDVAAADVKLQKSIIKAKEKAIEEAKKLQEKIKERLNVLDGIIDEIERLLNKYNLIARAIENWSDGISVASEEFIQASFNAGNKLVLGTGNPLDDYTRWAGCYAGVFTGFPYQGSEAVCFVTDNLKEIRTKYDEIIKDLPEILQWVIQPTKKASELAYTKVEPAMKRASLDLLKFATDEQTGEFLNLLMGGESATRNKLNEVYASDKSNKQLLIYNEVAKYVDKDLGISNGQLNVSTFYPLVHSVTMAKLALLDPETLNQLIADQTGEYASSYFGKEVYKPTDGNFSLLIGAIKSIDGNHQWQAYALPYPRRFQNSSKPSYGYNYYSDKSKGFKIWVDPYLRDKVFTRLFPGPVLGSMKERNELKWPFYKFPECDNYFFPTTQNNFGEVKDNDLVCNILKEDAGIEPYLTLSPQAFKKYYHQCDTVVWGNQHWTLIGSFLGKPDAEQFKADVMKRYPDLQAEVGRPLDGALYWTVMLATCTTEERAKQARVMAVKRRIALDAFVWTFKNPWPIAVERQSKKTKLKD